MPNGLCCPAPLEGAFSPPHRSRHKRLGSSTTSSPQDTLPEAVVGARTAHGRPNGRCAYGSPFESKHPTRSPSRTTTFAGGVPHPSCFATDVCTVLKHRASYADSTNGRGSNPETHLLLAHAVGSTLRYTGRVSAAFAGASFVKSRPATVAQAFCLVSTDPR